MRLLQRLRRHFDVAYVVIAAKIAPKYQVALNTDVRAGRSLGCANSATRAELSTY